MDKRIHGAPLLPDASLNLTATKPHVSKTQFDDRPHSCKCTMQGANSRVSGETPAPGHCARCADFPAGGLDQEVEKKKYARVHNSKELNAHCGYVIGDLLIRILHPSHETLQREFFCGGISIRFVEARNQLQCTWVVDELPNTVSAEQ